MSQFLVICVEESDSTVGFYDSASGAEVARVRVGLWPHEIDISPDGSLAYVSNFGVKDYDERIGDPGASISIIDVQRKVELDRLYTFTTKSEYRRFRAPHGLKLTPCGKQLYVNVESEDELLIYDIESSSCHRTPTQHWRYDPPHSPIDAFPDYRLSLPVGTHNILFNPDGTRLWVVSGIGGVSEYDVVSKRKLRSFYGNGAIRGLAYTIDQKQLIASARDEVLLVDPLTLNVERRFDRLGAMQILYSTQTPDQQYLLCPAVWEGQLLRININDGHVDRLIIGSDPIHVKIGPDQKAAYVTHGRSRFVSVIDWQSFTEIGRITTRGGPNGIAFAPFSPRPKRKLLTVGAVLPLSGGSSAEGQDLRLGYQYWQERVNEAGGIATPDGVYEVRVVFADSYSKTGAEKEEPQPWLKHWKNRTPPEMNSIEKATAKLVKDENATFLFGGYPSPPNLGSAWVGEEKRIPLITSSGAAGVMYEQRLEFFFGIMSTAQGFLNETFNYLSRLENQPKTAMFLSCDDPAAKQDAETTARHISDNLNMQILTDPDSNLPKGAQGIFLFKHFETDFGVYMNIVESLAPDVLAITGHLSEGIAAVESLRASGYAPKAVVFSVGPAFPQFSARLGDSAEHMMGAAMWSAVQSSAGHDLFIRPDVYATDYYYRFSKEASYLAAGATACGLAWIPTLGKRLNTMTRSSRRRAGGVSRPTRALPHRYWQSPLQSVGDYERASDTGQ